LVITAPGEASEAPAEVVLAVLFPRGDASLRRVACALEADADRLVPVEYRG
jgi:hypothetical protein